MNKILIKDNKFKSLLISVNYILPLNEKEASKNALVALIIQQGCDKYRSEKEIEMALAKLYNASINVNIEKLGDNYSITFELDILNKKYIDRDILEDSLEILKNIIYNPYLENGVFCNSYVDREKEALISRINEIKNNKKKYAITRLEQEMFKGEAYSVSKFGKIEDVQKETAESIYNQYLKIIKNGSVNVVISGNVDGYNNITELVIDKLGITNNNSNVDYVENKRNNNEQQLKNIEEYEELSQSILCMGLKFKCVLEQDIYAISIYNSILGETPASKLFQNVREKESLAYSASSQYIRFKEAIYIYTGINILDVDKAKEVIKEQIEDIKNGKVSDEEFMAAKMHIISKLKLIKDSKDGVAMYLVANKLFFKEKEITIEDMVRELESVSKEEVIDIASKVYIDTVYLLGGEQ